MAKSNSSYTDLLSRRRLELWAKGHRDPKDGRHELAERLLRALDVGDDACREVFAAILPGYFYNMSLLAKRQHFDSIGHAFCEDAEAADELFNLFRKEKWTGRTSQS